MGRICFPRIMYFPYFPQIMHFPYFPQITQIAAQITRIYLRSREGTEWQTGTFIVPPRWSSSGHDKAIHGSEFTGRSPLEFKRPR